MELLIKKKLNCTYYAMNAVEQRGEQILNVLLWYIRCYFTWFAENV